MASMLDTPDIPKLPGERVLGEEDERRLVTHLSRLVKWFEFGTAMGVPHHVLTKIEMQYAAYHGPDRCKIELVHYLIKNDPELTMSKVCFALLTIGEEGIAAHIQFSEDHDNPTVPRPVLDLTIGKKSEIALSLEQIYTKFTDLAVAIQKSLEESSTPLQDIMRYAFEFFKIEVKKEPKTMIEFFSRLRNHYCFIKYDVLQVLVIKFVKECMQAQMEEYEVTLDEWLQSTTVREFQEEIEQQQKVPTKQPEKHLCSQIPIFVILQDHWMDVMTDCLKRLIDHIFRYKSGLLSRIRVRKGSVIVKLMGLQSDMLPLLSIASKVASQMRFLGIMSIRVGRIVMSSPVDSQSFSSTSGTRPISYFASSLFSAVAQNDLLSIKSLLKIGLVSSDIMSIAMGTACRHGNDEIVQVLLQHGADVHFTANDKKSSPIHTAAMFGHIKVAEVLINAGLDPDYQDLGGITALMCACSNQKAMVEYLVSKKVNLDLQEKYGLSALMYACSYNNPEILEVLLKAGAHVNLRNCDGSTALQSACHEGYLKVAELLVKYKADLNLPMHNGATPLMSACHNGHSNIVRFLIRKKANLDAQARDGTTALRMAYAQSQKKIMSMLLEAKVNVNTIHSNGRTVLFEATGRNDIDTVKQLLQAKANPNLALDDGIGPLHLACSGNVEITDLLLRAGALVGKVGGSQSVAPLHIACQSGEYQIVELLLKYKANVNVVDGNGLTPLCIVAATGNTRIVNLLLAAGANIELQQNRVGWTPLFFAVARGHLEVVNLLIKHGASMEPNKQNKTPLDIATLAGHPMIVEALQAAAQGSKPTQASSSSEEKRITKRTQPLSEEIEALPYFSILMEGFLFYKNFQQSYTKSPIIDLPPLTENLVSGIQAFPFT